MNAGLKTQTLEEVIGDGVKHGASVIHFERFERGGLVKYRIGNWLGMARPLREPELEALIIELKKRAHLKRSAVTEPQDGHLELSANKKPLEVELSIVPVLGGEKVVMHLIPKDTDTNSLEDIGFWGEGLAALRLSLTDTYGLILAAGHQRDGVSDTLNSMADLLDSPLSKIARIDQSRKKSANLQDALDEDSSIIMIGHLADKQTAVLAADTALKRRLILAGIYADGAIDALGHLRALGIEPFVLASVTRLSIGQRQLRRLCQTCAVRNGLKPSERKKLEKDFGLGPALNRKIYELEQSALESGIGPSPLSSTSNRITHIWRPSKKGCEDCKDGYSGSIAAVEVLPVAGKLQKLLAADKAPNRQELLRAATDEGFVPMLIDGLVKNLRGQTDINEVLRVCRP